MARALNSTAPRLSRRQALGVLAASPLLTLAGAQEAAAPVSLFDGTTLGKWKPVSFGGEGEVSIVNGAIRLERGNDLTGVVWTGKVPGPSFRVQMEAMRLDGTDFFCAVTVPVGRNYCTFVVGGWGGTVVGFSSLDGLDASENETSHGMTLTDGRWYRVGVDVTPIRIQGLIDDKVVAEATLAGRDVDVRIEMMPCRPLGIASWRTTSDIRAITLLERS
jgi:hypothetical protein